MNRLLLFDIDGTILNMKMGVSKKIFIDTFFDIYGTAITLDKMPRFSGNTDLQILNQMADAIGFERSFIANKIEDFWNLKLERFKQYCTNEYISLIPGIKNLLADLNKNKDYELYLVTGNSRKNAYQKLSAYELGIYFKDGAFGCENSDRNLLPPLAVNRANLSLKKEIFNSENTIIIGDTDSDVLAAKSNKMKIMAIADYSNFPYFQSKKVDSVISDFLDIDLFYNEIERMFYQ